MRNRRLKHETLGFQRHAVEAGAGWEFQPGDRVLADGLPGVVASVDDTNPYGIESYTVTLDNSLGGGEYTAAQLQKPGSTTAALISSQDVSDELSPVEGSFVTTADHWYPELGTILYDRPPNERIQRTAGLQRTAFGPSQYVFEPGTKVMAAGLPGYIVQVLPQPVNQPFGEHSYVVGFNQGLGQQIFTQAQLVRTAAYDPRTEESVQEPPTVCSFCGNPGPWTDEQDTGRGTRIRCATCGGTMRLNDDPEAGTSGIQWQPEFPNSPENAASRAGDPRATINDIRIVHSRLNAPATEEAGYAIFTNPELLAHLNQQLQATAASLSGVADEEFVFHFTAAWSDVRKKATRIRKEGGVRILVANNTHVVGEVQGDTALYESALNYVPGTKKVADWACGCKWGAYAWGRSPAYKRFEGRQCSHVLALQYEAQARGMFGREVSPDRDRLEGQYQRSPVQVQYERPSERYPEGRDLRRRTVPPGNMRRTFSSLEKDAYLVEDVPPSHEWARLFTALGTPPSEVVHAMHALGVPHAAARAAIDWATKSTASAAVATEDGQTHVAVAVENGLVHTAAGRQLPVDAVHLVLAKEQQSATADPGQGEPGTDIPRIDKRDQSAKKKDPRHLRHHTNDAREHAPIWGYGVPWGGAYMWCGQCLGSGCGHCGGSGQVAAPTTGTAAPSDASTTSSPVADQSVDAGGMIGGGGISATGAVRRVHLQAKQSGMGPALCGAEPDADMPNHKIATVVCEACAQLAQGIETEPRRMIHEAVQHTADYTSGDFGNYNSQTPAQQITPHANTPNPASTGWAASADPSGWERPVVDSSFMHWESMLHHGFVMTAAGDTSKPPTHAGVALKAADTGRVLMIQRSNKDEKDPARGTWEFPGGGREDGDLTSLHTGIREWEEEVGQAFPQGGHVTHVHRSGPYVLHTVVIPEESGVDFTNGRATVNPDDPDGDDHEQSAWWDPAHAKKNPALRPECKSSPWGDISKAAVKIRPTPAQDGPLPMEEGMYYRLHHPDRPFSREDASSKNNGAPPHPDLARFFEPKSGYSAFWNPHHLHQYLDEMGWDRGERGSKVVRFRGTPVGEGGDGEPRVMPHSDRPDEVMSVKRFQDRLDITDNGYGRWYEHTWGDGPHGQQVDDGYRTVADFAHQSSVTSVTMVRGNDDRPTYNPAEQGLAATTAASDDWFTDQQKKYWDVGYQHGMQGLHGLYDRGKEDQVMYDMPPSHLRAPYQEGHEEAIRNLKPEPEALSHRFMQPAQAGHCATCGSPSDEIGEHTGQCPRCDALQNVGAPPNRPEPYGGEHRRNSGPQIFHGEHEDFDLRGYHPEEHLMHSLSSQQDLDLIFQGTLHDEPEPALPSTTGDNAVDEDSGEELGGDEDAATYDPASAVQPGIPVDRAAPWGYPESAADHPNPAVAQPGSADLDMESAPEDQDQSALESVISNFQRSAGFQALMSDAAPQGGSGDGPTDADIAAAARAALTKTSMKDFSFAEQQELIAEGGGKARARNFSDLKIAGTHYEMLGDGEPDDEALHLFL